MRERYVKSHVGRRTTGRKELVIAINKAGLSANGEQRLCYCRKIYT